MMKKLKIVFAFSVVMAFSVVGFMKSQHNEGIAFQSIEQLSAFKAARADDEDGLGKKCYEGPRCPSGTYKYCDGLGSGSKCACYYCN